MCTNAQESLELEDGVGPGELLQFLDVSGKGFSTCGGDLMAQELDAVCGEQALVRLTRDVMLAKTIEEKTELVPVRSLVQLATRKSTKYTKMKGRPARIMSIIHC